MTAIITSVETFASKFHNIFSLLIICMIVWYAAAAWTSLTADVSCIRTADIPKIHEEMNVIREDIRSVDVTLRVVESDVKILKQDVDQIKREMTEIKDEMRDMRADIKRLLNKHP